MRVCSVSMRRSDRTIWLCFCRVPMWIFNGCVRRDQRWKIIAVLVAQARPTTPRDLSCFDMECAVAVARLRTFDVEMRNPTIRSDIVGQSDGDGSRKNGTIIVCFAREFLCRGSIPKSVLTLVNGLKVCNDRHSWTRKMFCTSANYMLVIELLIHGAQR